MTELPAGRVVGQPGGVVGHLLGRDLGLDGRVVHVGRDLVRGCGGGLDAVYRPIGGLIDDLVADDRRDAVVDLPVAALARFVRAAPCKASRESEQQDDGYGSHSLNSISRWMTMLT